MCRATNRRWLRTGTGQDNDKIVEIARNNASNLDNYGTMFTFSSSRSPDSTRFNLFCSVLNGNLLSLGLGVPKDGGSGNGVLWKKTFFPLPFAEALFCLLA